MDSGGGLADGAVSKQDLEELSEFRYRLRCFLRFSEKIARREGVTPQQYMLMLHTQGFPERHWASVGELAHRLQASPHGTVALVTRCELAGLVTRTHSEQDRRLVEVHLLPKGEACLARLAAAHRPEIRVFGWRLDEPGTCA